MKKRNIICALLSNAAIIMLIAVLFFAVNPMGTAVGVSAPIYYGDRETGRVALMFNVYEGSENVEKILDILDRYKVNCTFFVGGVWAEKNMSLLKRMSERAEIGNHGYLHRDHAKLNYRSNEEEIMLCHNLVKEVCGIEMTLFAPPSGSYSDACLSVCNDRGYRVIMWNKDTIDWRDKDRDVITKRATSGTQSGDMILMHPTEQTVRALPEILEEFARKHLIASAVGDVI